jgi:thiol-disulfide isomerase/thioredoxin
VKRRVALVGAVAAVAGAAGMGGALWRARSVASAPAGADIWPMRFDTPQGGQLELADLKGKPLLLNFWATWCPPCVTELPLIDRFHQAQQASGWQVVGLAVDNREPVLQFLGKTPVGYPVGIAGMGGVELSRNMGNTVGALPFTLVFDRAGKVVERKLGVLTPADLDRWVAEIR